MLHVATRILKIKKNVMKCLIWFLVLRLQSDLFLAYFDLIPAIYFIFTFVRMYNINGKNMNDWFIRI